MSHFGDPPFQEPPRYQSSLCFLDDIDPADWRGRQLTLNSTTWAVHPWFRTWCSLVRTLANIRNKLWKQQELGCKQHLMLSVITGKFTKDPAALNPSKGLLVENTKQPFAASIPPAAYLQAAILHRFMEVTLHCFKIVRLDGQKWNEEINIENKKKGASLIAQE